MTAGSGTRAPSQYPKRRLSVRSRQVSKPRDWYLKLSYRFEIWQAHRQHCCRRACQISERSDNSKYKSRGFETLWDLTKRRLFGYWDGAQPMPAVISVNKSRVHAKLRPKRARVCDLCHLHHSFILHSPKISFVWSDIANTPQLQSF